MLRGFLRGVGSLLNISPPASTIRMRISRTDAEAMRSDWEAVGLDLWNGVEAFVDEDRLKPRAERLRQPRRFAPMKVHASER